MWMWQMEWPNIGDHTSIFQKVKRMQSAYLVILQYKKNKIKCSSKTTKVFAI
jgi:hypothetical protein